MIPISVKIPVLPRDLDAPRVQTKNISYVKNQANAFIPSFVVMDTLNVLTMRMKTCAVDTWLYLPVSNSFYLFLFYHLHKIKLTRNIILLHFLVSICRGYGQ